MVAPDGVVKVLDCRLAREAEGSPPTTSAAASAESPPRTPPVRFAHATSILGVITGAAVNMARWIITRGEVGRSPASRNS